MGEKAERENCTEANVFCREGHKCREDVRREMRKRAMEHLRKRRKTDRVQRADELHSRHFAIFHLLPALQGDLSAACRSKHTPAFTYE